MTGRDQMWRRRTVGNSLNLGRGAYRLIGRDAALGLDQVRGKDGIDQRRLAQSRLAYNFGESA